jgi:hypothetical protein
MKNYLLLITTLFVCGTNIFAQVPSYVPTNGLVGWWPFNGNANDESGNGNNGTVNGAIITSDRFGSSNSAYDFNSGSVNMNNLAVSLTNNYSISFWAKPMNYVNGYTVAFELTQNFNCNDNPLIGFWANNLIYHTCSDIYTNVGMGNFILMQGQWNHFVITLNNGLTTTYKNGEFYDSGNIVWPNIIANKLTIGNSGNGLSSPSPFKGQIDDFGIWNRSLTFCEIQDLYNSQVGTSNTVNATSCINYTWNGNIYTQSGQYTYQTSNVNGCDSTAILNLTINQPTTSTTTQVACSSYFWNGNTYNTSGTYTYPTTNQNGCDSTATLNLTINQPSSSTQTEIALDSYIWPVNNQTYTQSGTYTAVITNTAGCDSTITLELTMQFTGIEEHLNQNVSISPNPTSDYFVVSVSEEIIGESYSIIDLNGKTLKEGTLTQNEKIIEIGNLSEGVYLFRINNETVQTLRIVKN